jgi:hypothetical protein
MPADFQLDRTARTVHTRAWGDLTDEDIFGHMASIAALFREGALDGDWAQICDFTGVTSMDGVSSAGVRRAAEGNPWPRYAVRAFIVGTGEQFGLARMYQALGDPKTDDLCITSSADDARAFVGRERARLGIAI